VFRHYTCLTAGIQDDLVSWYQNVKPFSIILQLEMLQLAMVDGGDAGIDS